MAAAIQTVTHVCDGWDVSLDDGRTLHSRTEQPDWQAWADSIPVVEEVLMIVEVEA